MLTFTCFLFCIPQLHAQNLTKYLIVDSKSKKELPGVVVSIIHADISIRTDADAYFELDMEGLLEDTLLLSYQGYNDLKMPIKKLKEVKELVLEQKPIKAINQKIEKQQKEILTLNQVDKNKITHFAGVHTNTTPFKYLQLAQRFQGPAEGMTLKALKIYMPIPIAASRKITKEQELFLKPYNFKKLPPFTIFRVRIYDEDPTTHQPGIDLCSSIIELKNNDQLEMEVDLDKYNVSIPGKAFFVAIEWMRNGNNVFELDIVSGKMQKLHAYKPFIALSPLKGSQLNVYALNFRNEWAPFTYFMPHLTDLAITATLGK